jgi:hypothetical protein
LYIIIEGIREGVENIPSAPDLLHGSFPKKDDLDGDEEEKLGTRG